MRRLALVGLIACLLSGLAAATAQADYYISKKRAEPLRARYFHYKIGYHYTACGVRKSDRAVSAADPPWSADPFRTLTHP